MLQDRFLYQAHKTKWSGKNRDQTDFSYIESKTLTQKDRDYLLLTEYESHGILSSPMMMEQLKNECLVDLLAQDMNEKNCIDSHNKNL